MHLGKGVQSGGFLIPQNKIDQLIAYKHLLTDKQKRDILNSVQSGGQLVLKPTKSQYGGFLGTLLASIGIPLAIEAIKKMTGGAPRMGSDLTKGMPPFQEIVNHAKRTNMTLLHQSDQIQNLLTTTCGYFCLYFLNEMSKGRSYYDLLKVFNSHNTMENEKYIENYFKII